MFLTVAALTALPMMCASAGAILATGHSPRTFVEATAACWSALAAPSTMAALLARRAAGEVQALARAAASMGTDTPYCAPPRPLSAEHAELSARLATALHTQAARRQDALARARHEAFARIADELHFPLADLRRAADALQDPPQDPARHLTRITTNVARINRLVDALLIANAHTDDGDEPERPVPGSHQGPWPLPDPPDPAPVPTQE
ncbi:hypothetical protein GCM10018781_77850 [Kitasatospora indigofera]|uniref:histidine kinase n=1 Tax=Kitasatospora indigofera TaxID=67307 RepID=A0A918YUS5_9ACTN|nr:hypothetical protein GCM10018781_77850 [Kitasatospora indigofera]